MQLSYPLTPERGPAARAVATRAVVALAALLFAPLDARAEGELRVRGVYYKERSTRVVQPMLDARVALDDDTELTAHTLVDVITSASAGAGAAGVPFTERRYELGAGVAHRVGDYTCGVSGRFSYEPDYLSLFGGARCQVALAQQNTLLGLALALGNDDLSNAGAQDEMGQLERLDGKLRSVLVSTSLTQILSPVLVAGLTYDLIYVEGFLESPYRRVPVAGGGMGVLVPEAVPASRLRHALAGSVRGFVPVTGSTWIAGYRFYVDDWDIRAHTPELRLIQELRPDLDLHARYRFHRQSAAYFYEPTYAGDEPFLTSDIKLSELTTHTFGVELESALEHAGVVGLFGDARLELVLEYVVQRNRLGNALVLQTALSMPFGD
ncbi:MAG TPA: DUF3570 domain-containing protein [Haliangium sp.]|nr:DUF3570 domain-containing protein [Haliangium sp.]